jgi:hypothetical protein
MKKIIAVISLLVLNALVVVSLQQLPISPAVQATFTPQPGMYVLPFQQPLYQVSVPKDAFDGRYNYGSLIIPVRTDVNGDGLIDALFQSRHTGNFNSVHYSQRWKQEVWLNNGRRLVKVVDCTYLQWDEYNSACVPVAPVAGSWVPTPFEYVLPARFYAFSLGVAGYSRGDGSRYTGHEFLPLLMDVNGDGLPDLTLQKNFNGDYRSTSPNTFWEQKVWLNNGAGFTIVSDCTYGWTEYEANCT